MGEGSGGQRGHWQREVAKGWSLTVVNGFVASGVATNEVVGKSGGGGERGGGIYWLCIGGARLTPISMALSFRGDLEYDRGAP